MTNDILIVVPARAGSKGVSDKNMFPIKGIPLIGYTFKLLNELEFDYCISTDDQKIIDYAKDFSLDIYFKRPDNLARDSSIMLDVLVHSIKEMEALKQKDYKYVILLQPTAPLRTTNDIKTCIKLMENSQPDSVISVNKVDSHHPILMKKINNGYLEPYFIEEIEGTRRQDYKPDAFMRNGAIYLTTRQNIIKNNSIWGKKIIPYVMKQNESISIDNMLDLFTLEAYLNK
jgi:CMP-N,N'-diacetyllegionaminic acid synthase